MISRWILLKMINISGKSHREYQNTYFVLNNFMPKSCRLWEKVQKYCTAGQAINVNIIERMRIACWITKATDTIRLFNNYCFSTANTVTRTHFNVALYVHCLSCLSSKIAFVYWKTLQCVSFIVDLSLVVATGCHADAGLFASNPRGRTVHSSGFYIQTVRITCRIWRDAIWQKCPDVSGKPAAYFLRITEWQIMSLTRKATELAKKRGYGGCTFLRSVCT